MCWDKRVKKEMKWESWERLLRAWAKAPAIGWRSSINSRNDSLFLFQKKKKNKKNEKTIRNFFKKLVFSSLFFFYFSFFWKKKAFFSSEGPNQQLSFSNNLQIILFWKRKVVRAPRKERNPRTSSHSFFSFSYDPLVSFFIVWIEKEKRSEHADSKKTSICADQLLAGSLRPSAHSFSFFHRRWKENGSSMLESIAWWHFRSFSFHLSMKAIFF